MIIFIISFFTTLSLFCCYIYYNSVKDIYQNDDINEFLLSSVLDNDFDNNNDFNNNFNNNNDFNNNNFNNNNDFNNNNFNDNKNFINSNDFNLSVNIRSQLNA
jgi:hypothetical protein